MIDRNQTTVERFKSLSPMGMFYAGIAVALVLTVLSVLLIPGVDDFVEQIFQRYLGRAAR